MRALRRCVKQRGVPEAKAVDRLGGDQNNGSLVFSESRMTSATSQVPHELGRFGPFGRRFVPETLMRALEELTDEYLRAKADPVFAEEFDHLLGSYVGRPSPLYFAERLTSEMGGAKIFLKREDLNHTGAHKINNTVGQLLLTRRMGKTRVIAETGAGQHGVATATACARFGLECVVYMGTEDIRRQQPNVHNMTCWVRKSGGFQRILHPS
ncbi:MAG: hypothetical protein CM1200mP2_25720 [Planctomycetaceae bacterium]|nr:MAG: hypothetical protein CM1200mP2_25720 [Planctomycetaceae bacterium]